MNLIIMNREELKHAMLEAQNLQLELVKAQQELSHKEIEGVSDNGLVNVIMNAEGQYKSLKINPSILKFAHNILEESVLQAIDNANRRAAELTRSKLAEITKQIGL
jgi:DNA-binding YbaB/EbfC family protein